MSVLVINCGSSSIKADVLSADARRLLSLHVDRIGQPTAQLRLKGEHLGPQGLSRTCPGREHDQALGLGLAWMLEHLPSEATLLGVGHRVVHGGTSYSGPVRIDAEVEATIAALSSLAPLHNPANLAGIRAARALLPALAHVAVFDTAFHATLPRRARTYALPHAFAHNPALRRFGFHGISHQFVAERAAQFLGADVRELRLITCHLGNGASVAAVEHGRSIETSTGMTPVEGLVMGTRSGDVDAGLLVHLMREHNWSVDELDHYLNRESGLLGISGVSQDMRDLEERAAQGHEPSRLAIQVFCHRVRKYIGAFAAVMGGVDAIILTAGIGENSHMARHRIAQRLEFLGARLDEDRNRDALLSDAHPVVEISAPHSRTRLLAVRTDEAQAIARQTMELVHGLDRTRGQRPIPVAISARHVHLSRPTLEALFGEGFELTAHKPLSQPGQFAAEQCVSLIGPKNRIDKVRILGPVRAEDQVEISRTDEFCLGIDAPVRASGDIANTPGITLEGPQGRVTIPNGVICAWRHIHMHPGDATHFGVQDRDSVEVRVDGGDRDLIFGDVLVRVSDQFVLEMHIDTDEGNAANLAPNASATLVRRALSREL